MKISKGLQQAYDMQDFTFEAAMALKKMLTNSSGKLEINARNAGAVAVVTKAWETAQERVRIHRGKPLPGSMTYEKVKRQRGPKAVASGWLDAQLSATSVETAPSSSDPQPLRDIGLEHRPRT